MTGAFEDQFAVSREEAAPSATLALQNVEAEISLLCDLIADNRLIDEAADRCRPVDFTVPLHGQVYGAILQQSATSRSVDAVTLAPQLKDEEGWPQLYKRLAGAHLNEVTRSRTLAYIQQIHTLASRRRLVTGLQEVIVSARTLDISHEALILSADEAVTELDDGEGREEQATVGDYAGQVLESFGKPIVGVSSGIRSLDAATGILRPGSENVVAGRPGMGKTAFATSYSIGASRRGHGVLFISLEMSADQLTRRILSDMCFTRERYQSQRGAIPYECLRDGTVPRERMAEVIAAKRELDGLPFEIAEPSGLTIPKLVRRVRRHRRKLAAQGQKLQLVVIDYLQLISPTRANMSPYEHATEISKGLKELARTEKVAVMALAQLNREVEKRQDKRPIKSDLRDSGQIEQDADLIVFLYREEEYLKLAEPENEFSPEYASWRTDMEAVRDKIEFIVDKRRDGPRAKAFGWFFGAHQAMRSADFFSAIEEDPRG